MDLPEHRGAGVFQRLVKRNNGRRVRNDETNSHKGSIYDE